MLRCEYFDRCRAVKSSGKCVDKDEAKLHCITLSRKKAEAFV